MDTDCRTQDGITVGLIDTIINSFRLLRTRDITTNAVKEALIDLREDEDMNYFINEKKNKE